MPIPSPPSSLPSMPAFQDSEAQATLTHPLHPNPSEGASLGKIARSERIERHLVERTWTAETLTGQIHRNPRVQSDGASGGEELAEEAILWETLT